MSKKTKKSLKAFYRECPVESERKISSMNAVELRVSSVNNDKLLRFAKYKAVLTIPIQILFDTYQHFDYHKFTMFDYTLDNITTVVVGISINIGLVAISTLTVFFIAVFVFNTILKRNISKRDLIENTLKILMCMNIIKMIFN